MGNIFTSKNVNKTGIRETLLLHNTEIDELFNAFIYDLMIPFNETNVGKLDAIAFYGDIREILIIDIDNKKYEIQCLVEKYERKCKPLTYKQTQMLNTIYELIQLDV